jgi:hypothetical protein
MLLKFRKGKYNECNWSGGFRCNTAKNEHLAEGFDG